MREHVTGPASSGAYTDLTALIQLRYAHQQLETLTLPRSTNPLSGLLTSRFQGRGIDFSEVRVYQPGDDVRTIDWRVTARTQTAHTKLFQEEKERPILVLVDQSASMFFGSRTRFKSVAAADAAALLAWVHLSRGDRVGGIVVADHSHREVRPRRSKHSVLRLIHELHDYNHRLDRNAMLDAGSGYLGEALGNVRRVARHGCAIYVISDFRDFSDTARLHLRQLQRHNDIVGIHVYDPLEAELPPPERYTITDGAARTRIDTANPGNRARYAEAFAAHRQAIGDVFSRMRSPLIDLSTDDNLITHLAERFGEREAGR